MENENRILNFDLSANQIKYKDILSKEFIELEIWAISDINPNRNGSHFTVDSLIDAIPNVKNKPIVGFFENNDFTTHEGRADYDKELQKEFWNTEKGERILGWVRESDPVEVVEKDGLHWLKFRCILCTTYCYKQVKRLLKDRRKKVSVEITVHKHEFIDNIEQIYQFSLNGVTILGSKNGRAVLEGIPDAHLSVLDVIDENAIEQQKKVLTFAYRQFEESTSQLSNSNTIVEEEANLDEENTKKEVNHADMDQVELENSNYAASIKVDKSKEAMSDKPWGEVDKTELRRKVVEADNFKSIADDIFLDLREGWEEGEVSKLKYPVMELKENTAVYNRGGLASAKAYAEQHDDQKVLDKLAKIYKDLELDDSEEDKEVACKMALECKEDYECNCEECVQEACECDGEHECKMEVVVENITPDVAVIEETKEEINEENRDLTMETEQESAEVLMTDVKVEESCVSTQSEEACEETREETCKETHEEACEGSCEEGSEECEAAANVVSNDDYCRLLEKCATLEKHCCELEEIIKEQERIISEYSEKMSKYSDYEELKKHCEEAEKALENYRCKELKAYATALMSEEDIKTELYNEIIDKCCKGTYGCEEDIKKDVAIAIYTSRPMQEKRFSVSLSTDPVVNTDKDVKRRVSPEEGIRQYIKK